MWSYIGDTSAFACRGYYTWQYVAEWKTSFEVGRELRQQHGLATCMKIISLFAKIFVEFAEEHIYIMSFASATHLGYFICRVRSHLKYELAWQL